MKLLSAFAAICGAVTIDGEQGSAIIVNDYANTANQQNWSVKSSGSGKTLLLKFASDANIAYNKQECIDQVTVQPKLNGEDFGPVHNFCGPNKDGYLVMPNGAKFPNQSANGGNGQKAFHFQWDTQVSEVDIKFIHNGQQTNGKFEIELSEQNREYLCRTRGDCTAMGKNKHICDFNDITKEKVCTSVDCTKHNHCTNEDFYGGVHETCQGNVCTPVECTHRKHCDDKHVCDNKNGNVCKPVECTSHDHCPAKHRCDGKTNTCEEVGCKNKDDCADNALCVKNECKVFECRGHSHCKKYYGSGPNSKEDRGCQDGSCRCDNRVCKKKECVKNSHCKNTENSLNFLRTNGFLPAKAPICRDFQCVAYINGIKSCIGHNHCPASNKCDNHQCKSVQCRYSIDCDSKKLELGFQESDDLLCYDESAPANLQNTCYKVECKSHDTCGPLKVCQENSCVPVKCRVNSDCVANQICEKVDKKDPTKNYCKDVQCTSNRACKQRDISDACNAGKCLCKDKQCVEQPCVKTAHCGPLSKCHDNECVPVECNGHGDCDQAFPANDGGFKPAKCDDNCRTENGRTYCEPKCVEVGCRTEADCPDIDEKPYICLSEAAALAAGTPAKANKCKKVECRGHAYCGEKERCENHQCVPKDCVTNEHCDAEKSEICLQQKAAEDKGTPWLANTCYKVDCLGHSFCGEYQRCKSHKCVNQECVLNEHCNTNAAVGAQQKCNKVEGICEDVQCIGHDGCDNHEGCEAGHCLCKNNQCEKQACRVNSHCRNDDEVQERCLNNVCEAVDCTAHEHCAYKGEKFTCKDNICIDVDCRINQHCASDEICGGEENGNKCKKVDCIGHAMCESNYNDRYFCKDHKCIEMPCRQNKHCNGGDPNGKNICKNNECESVECSAHDHCLYKGSNWMCREHVCEEVGCRTQDDCAADELCDKDTNTCKTVDCRGHGMCQEKALEGVVGLENCADGHCLCKENECEYQQCRTNAHCGEKERCNTDTNTCETVACNGHPHCLQDERPECLAGKCRCIANECEPVSCRTEEHCAADEICTGENPDGNQNGSYFTQGKLPNTCVQVDCKGHGDCKAKENCSAFKCVPVECTDQTHCNEKEICQAAECVEKECRKHEHCADKFPAGQAYKCLQQNCQPVGCTSTEHCASNELCNKTSNECYQPDCIGHASCITNSSKQACKDGKCLCLDNKCRPQECRTNDHCGEKQRCRDNECVDVDCTSHDHCSDSEDLLKRGKCFENNCIMVDCVSTVQCNEARDEPHVCNNEVCEKVPCVTTADCDQSKPSKCVANQCLVQQCVGASDCKDEYAGFNCIFNQCVDPAAGR